MKTLSSYTNGSKRQQSGHNFDAIIFPILDFRSLLSFGHWRAHSPNRAIAVGQLNSLNRSFALYLQREQLKGWQSLQAALPLNFRLALACKSKSTGTMLCKESGSYRSVKFFLGDDSSMHLQPRDFDDWYTQRPFGWFLKMRLEGKCCAIASHSSGCLGKGRSWAMAKRSTNRFRIPNHSNPIQQLKECWSQRH